MDAARRALAALDEDDSYLVAEVAKEWDDLQAGIAAAKPVSDVIADDPSLFGRARDAAAIADTELPEDVREARSELADLIAAGDLVDQIAKVRSLVDAVSDAKATYLEATQADASAALEALRVELVAEAAGLDDEVVEGAIAARLGGLDPSGATTVEQVLARRARYGEGADLVRADLDAVRSAGRIVRLHVASVLQESGHGPLQSVEELDGALDAVRSRALEALDDGKEVRLT